MITSKGNRYLIMSLLAFISYLCFNVICQETSKKTRFMRTLIASCSIILVGCSGKIRDNTITKGAEITATNIELQESILDAIENANAYTDQIYSMLSKISDKKSYGSLSSKTINKIKAYLSQLSYEDLWRYTSTKNHLVGLELFRRFDSFIEDNSIQMLDDFILKRNGLELKFEIPLSNYYYQVPQTTLDTMRRHNKIMMRYRSKISASFVYWYEHYWLDAVERIKSNPDLIKSDDFSISRIKDDFILSYYFKTCCSDQVREEWEEPYYPDFPCNVGMYYWASRYKGYTRIPKQKPYLKLMQDVIDLLIKRVVYELSSGTFKDHMTIAKILCNDIYREDLYGFVQLFPKAERRLRSAVLAHLESFMSSCRDPYVINLLRRDKEFSRALDKLMDRKPALFLYKDELTIDCTCKDFSNQARANRNIQRECVKMQNERQRRSIKRINDDISKSIANKDVHGMVNALISMVDMKICVKISDKNIKLMNSEIEFVRKALDPRNMYDKRMFNEITHSLQDAGVRIIDKNLSHHIEKYMLDFINTTDKYDKTIEYLMSIDCEDDSQTKTRKSAKLRLKRIKDILAMDDYYSQESNFERVKAEMLTPKSISELSDPINTLTYARAMRKDTYARVMCEDYRPKMYIGCECQLSSKTREAIKAHLSRISDSDLLRYYEKLKPVYNEIFARITKVLESGSAREIADCMRGYWGVLDSLQYTRGNYEDTVPIPDEIIKLITKNRDVFWKYGSSSDYEFFVRMYCDGSRDSN